MDNTTNTPVNTTPTVWQRTKKRIVRFLLILLTLVVLVLSYFVFTPYSEGARAGTLVKLNKKGYLFKTYEGELSQTLVVGDLSSASANSRLWEFSVSANDTALINKLNTALLTGRRVELNYEEKYIVFSWQGDTKYFITSAQLSK